MTAAQAVTTAPPAPVLTVVRDMRTGDRTVTVKCPFGCRKAHTHGWPPQAREVRLRVSHCGHGDYWVVVVPWAPPTYRSRRGPNKPRARA